MVVDIYADVARNRLYVRLQGQADDTQARSVGDAILREMERMRPGFDLVSDLSQARPLGPEGLLQFKRVLEVARERKVGRTVRIVGGAAQTALQLTRTSKEFNHEPYLAFSREEAERLLEAPMPWGDASPGDEG